MKCQILFSVKNEKKYMSAELAQRVVMVNSVSGMNTSEFYHRMKFLVTNESWDRCKNLQIPLYTRDDSNTNSFLRQYKCGNVQEQ